MESAWISLVVGLDHSFVNFAEHTGSASVLDYTLAALGAPTLLGMADGEAGGEGAAALRTCRECGQDSYQGAGVCTNEDCPLNAEEWPAFGGCLFDDEAEPEAEPEKKPERPGGEHPEAVHLDVQTECWFAREREAALFLQVRRSNAATLLGRARSRCHKGSPSGSSTRGHKTKGSGQRGHKGRATVVVYIPVSAPALAACRFQPFGARK